MANGNGVRILSLLGYGYVALIVFSIAASDLPPQQKLTIVGLVGGTVALIRHWQLSRRGKSAIPKNGADAHARAPWFLIAAAVLIFGSTYLLNFADFPDDTSTDVLISETRREMAQRTSACTADRECASWLAKQDIGTATIADDRQCAADAECGAFKAWYEINVKNTK